MTRTFSTKNPEFLSIARASLQSGKPMEPIRLTATVEGEDPVVKGIVTSIRETGNGWYRVEETCR